MFQSIYTQMLISYENDFDQSKTLLYKLKKKSMEYLSDPQYAYSCSMGVEYSACCKRCIINVSLEMNIKNFPYSMNCKIFRSQISTMFENFTLSKSSDHQNLLLSSGIFSTCNIMNEDALLSWQSFTFSLALMTFIFTVRLHS